MVSIFPCCGWKTSPVGQLVSCARRRSIAASCGPLELWAMDKATIPRPFVRRYEAVAAWWIQWG